MEDKEIDKVEKGIDRVNKDKEVGSKERGSRLCLLETVTELGLRNLLFVYFLFGGRVLARSKQSSKIDKQGCKNVQHLICTSVQQVQTEL